MTTKSHLPLSSVEITFLGTASAQPSSTRNHSSLALQLAGDVWLFDCGEGTQKQLQNTGVKRGKIEKIFITHTHGDHIFGVVPLMASMLNGSGGMAEGAEDSRSKVDLQQPQLEIYGPYGTRAYIRNNIIHTHTLLGAPYVVHELRFSSDPLGDPEPSKLAHAESPNGCNILQKDGVWSDFFDNGVVSVSAAPILHSVPCVGYVVQEAPVPGKIDPKVYIPDLKRTNTPMSALGRLQRGENVELSDGSVLHGPKKTPGRKLVILGDTYDPSAIIPLAMEPDILIHEATNAHLPGIDSSTKDADTIDSVEERTKSRGHSTPQMAGKFAKAIKAKNLVLNHFSSRYSGEQSEGAMTIMNAIGKLAADEFGDDVTCALDFMIVKVDLKRD
ncbi:Metallo-hydrolase/oxidoreductase [Pluteus cervinus]|uniref:Metallo-hydrolase/oxidoreductase n=1 Tax=Pluteus cervinus TaxID=181527 RepID=A0ACD3BBP9_9AGAR|nr:Metallo-hydrolase/oxidoreductase [Pluteus cervinus]